MIHADSGVCPVSSSSVLIMDNLKELAHILIAVDIAKEIEEKQTWGIITRGAIRGITVCYQRSYKGEIDQGGYHPGISSLDSVIGKDLNKAFFKAVM